MVKNTVGKAWTQHGKQFSFTKRHVPADMENQICQALPVGQKGPI